MFTIKSTPTNSTNSSANGHTVTNHAAFSLAIRRRKKSENQVKEAPIPIIMTSSPGSSSPRRKISIHGEHSNAIISPTQSHPKLQFIVEKQKIQNSVSVSTYARIVTNYEASSEDELTVTEGDLVKILEEGKDNWTVVSRIASAITKTFYGAVPSSLGKGGFLSSTLESTSPPSHYTSLTDNSPPSQSTTINQFNLVGMIPQHCYELIDKKEVIQLLSQNDSQEVSSVESPRTPINSAVSLPRLALTNSMKELKKALDNSPSSKQPTGILSPKQPTGTPPSSSTIFGNSPPKTIIIPHQNKASQQLLVPTTNSKLKKSLSDSHIPFSGISLIHSNSTDSTPMLFDGVTYYDDDEYSSSDYSSEEESHVKNEHSLTVSSAQHVSVVTTILVPQCKTFLYKTKFDKFIRQSKELASQRKRREIITEIVETERTYVNLLNKCVSMYKQPIQQQKLLDDKMIDTIFLNLESIKTLHELFLKDLEKEYQGNRHLGKVFCRFMESLKVYTEYINRYSDAMETLNTIQSSKSYSKFRVFLGKIAEETYGFSLNLEALLVLPIQRVPRYKLLLKELLQTTITEHVDYESISKCYARICEIAMFINEEKRRADNSITVQELAAGLKGSFKSFNKQLLYTMNVKVHHEEVKQQILSGELIRWEECKAFIFEDMIVLNATHSPKASPRGTLDKVKSLLFNNYTSDDTEDYTNPSSSLFRKKTILSAGSSLTVPNSNTMDDSNRAKFIFFPFAQFYILDQSMIEDMFGSEMDDWDFGVNPLYSHDYSTVSKHIMLEYLEEGTIHRSVLAFDSMSDYSSCQAVLENAFQLYTAKRGQEKNITEYVKKKLIYETEKLTSSKSIHDLEQEKWAVEKQLNHSTAELKKLYRKLHKLQQKINVEQNQFMKWNEQMDSLTQQMQNHKTTYETAVHEILLRDQTLIELAGNNETYQRVLGKRKSGLKGVIDDISNSSLLIPGLAAFNPLRKSNSNHSFQ